MTEKGGQFRKEEILNNINELLEAFEKNSTNNERTMLMMNLITRLMGGEAFMKQMCESMCSGMFSQGTTSGGQQKDSTCCTEHKGLISESGEKDVASKEITCCSSQNIDSSKLDDNSSDYESIKIQKTRNICPMCEDYAKAQVTKPVVIMSCEGACLRGEVSRQAANIVCHSLLPETTVRLCLGGAFTKDGGQRNLVRNAQKVVALEGCFIKCASRMMKGVVHDMEPEIIITDRLFDFDTNMFGINEMPEDEIKSNSTEVAKIVANRLSNELGIQS